MIITPYLETIHRHSASSGNKLEQPGSHLVTEGEDNSPVPLYHYVVGMEVTLVNCVGLPILHINAPNAAHKKLKLP